MNGFLQDGNGDKSSTRLGVLVWVAGVFIVWAAICLTKGELVEIPASIGGILAAMMTAKVFQTHIETKKE